MHRLKDDLIMDNAPGEPRGHAISPDSMIPDVLAARPQLRPVFDRYGLRGCGGAHGPAETIGYFARAHGADVDQLLRELHEAERTSSVAAPEPAEPNPLDALADSIYRRFFKAGIVVVLTAGAAWGAYLLSRIAFAGSFTAISIHDINAHGHAQIFGWVGLFVMGFAYQAFPRMRHSSLWRPDLANLSFYLMVFGIIARTVGEPLFAIPVLRELALCGAIAEFAAIVLFVTVIVRTLQRSGKPYAWHDAYVFAALGFFVLQAVGELGLLYATTAATTRDQLLSVVATWQAPLRDIQIHGFAMLMILGVGIRMFPALFGLPECSAKLVRNALFALLFAIVGEVTFFLLMRQTGRHVWAGPLYFSVIVLAAATFAVSWRWLPFVRPQERDRSGKFIQTATTWLLVSMLMLLFAPVYMLAVLPGSAALSESGRQAVSIGFSHAYYGAVRHAITVGFISLMILGMGAKVVPTLNGVDIRALRPLWLPFALVNLGCLLRVSLQVATDFTQVAYPLVGISGVLEVTGIAVWGIHLWRIMNGWQPASAMAADLNRAITPDDKVGQIIAQHPAALPILLGRGFAPLANPLLRRTLARSVSLRTAAHLKSIDVHTLVDDLNAALGLRNISSDGELRSPGISA